MEDRTPEQATDAGPAPMDEVPRLIQALYDIVGRLEALFPGSGRHFTPDGHLVGSLGEALAHHHFGIALNPASTEGHDGWHNGRSVEVKTTQGDRIALSPRARPDHLLVFRLHPNGRYANVYNGPAAPVWALIQGRKPQKNGQQPVSLHQLRRLMREVVKPNERLEPVRALPQPGVLSGGLENA